MFWAVRAAAPRSLLRSASEGGGAAAGWLGLPGAGALAALGAVAGGAGAGGAAVAAGALALAEGDAAFRFSAGTPSGNAGCDPVPFPRVGR
jgi:hypothetical protein